MNPANDPRHPMTRAEAVRLLDEAAARLKRDHRNANGGSWQAGSA
ncbi:hypothetical protein EV683_1174 [Crenobacter luteus]|nr:hypothetical protein [Crenobacter luteus]TCP10887.1 hypothetical protein EV683_1174 [Crenobacter luteus]